MSDHLKIVQAPSSAELPKKWFDRKTVVAVFMCISVAVSIALFYTGNSEGGFLCLLASISLSWVQSKI